jgi:hypothetical protein
MNELKTRGVSDVLIAVVDGLKGFPEAIGVVFPLTTVQTPDRGPGQALHHPLDAQFAGLRVPAFARAGCARTASSSCLI